MPATAHDVAAFILREYGRPMSTMKLQKLGYYAQAWHLAWEGVPLFDDNIEAWANGARLRLDDDPVSRARPHGAALLDPTSPTEASAPSRPAVSPRLTGSLLSPMSRTTPNPWPWPPTWPPAGGIDRQARSRSMCPAAGTQPAPARDRAACGTSR